MKPTIEDALNLIRPDIAGMEPYTPIVPFEVLSEQLGRRPEDLVKLDANENPYGPSPKALAAMGKLDATAHIYPDPEARKLREALADYVGVGAEYIMAGAGADEIIDLLMRLFIQPGDGVINCPPSFGMYPFDAALHAANLIEVPRRADFSLDVEGIEWAAAQENVKLLLVCSPNNPDGGLIAPDDLDRLLRLPLIVVVDEAYIEFGGVGSASRRVSETPNLIVLRTFSKWAGLAGLRVGYGVFPLHFMEHLWKIKQPYNVNVAADAAARASLDDVETLMATVELLKAERERLAAELAAIPYLAPYPSRSNFILCRVDGIEAGELKHRLAEDYGILVRYYRKARLFDHVRFSVGKPEQTDRLIEALQAIGESL
ncbi:MAG: histidinol-phosphate transaminase [Anaerolineae bacterium]|nr:histidinol-phosphate transaminase [Anaerolineae bacterium]